MARPLPQLRSPGALRGATPGRAVAPTPGATLWVLPAADPPSVAGPCPSSGRAVIPRGRSRGSLSDCEPLEGRHPALPPSGVLRGPSRPCVAVSSWALTQPGTSCHRSVLRRQDGAGTSRAPEPVTPGARRGVLSVIEGHGKQNCLTQKSHPSPWPASHRRCTKEHASPGPPSPRPPAVRGPECHTRTQASVHAQLAPGASPWTRHSPFRDSVLRVCVQRVVTPTSQGCCEDGVVLCVKVLCHL